jgi:hypothetical protein
MLGAETASDDNVTPDLYKRRHTSSNAPPVFGPVGLAPPDCSQFHAGIRAGWRWGGKNEWEEAQE